ncbi:MFS transporter [Schumannella soli]|nr:MFS transporter [Schumannella soli]
MKRTFSLRSVSLVAVCAVMVAVDYGLIRLAFGLFLPDVARELGLSAAAAGVIAGGAAVSYCLAAAAAFATRGSAPRILLIGSVAAAALGGLGMAVATESTLFGASAIVGSAAAGAASPALVSIVDRNLSPRRATRAQGVVNAGTGIGVISAAALALLLLPDWRTAWVLSAGLAIVAGAAVIVLDRPAVSGEVRRAPRADRVWFLSHSIPVAAALALGAASAAVWNFGRTMMSDHGLEPQMSLVAWAALGLGAVVALVTAAPMSSLAPRTAWSIAAGAVAVGTAALMTLAGNAAGSAAACALFGWGYTASTNALIAWTTAIDSRLASAGTALLFIALVAGQAAGATLTGTIVESQGYIVALVAAAAIALVAGVIPRFRPGQLGHRPQPVSDDLS